MSIDSMFVHKMWDDHELSKMVDGGDPQLDAAIEQMLAEIKTKKLVEVLGKLPAGLLGDPGVLVLAELLGDRAQRGGQVLGRSPEHRDQRLGRVAIAYVFDQGNQAIAVFLALQHAHLSLRVTHEPGLVFEYRFPWLGLGVDLDPPPDAVNAGNVTQRNDVFGHGPTRDASGFRKRLRAPRKPAS